MTIKIIDNAGVVLRRGWASYGIYALALLGILNDYIVPVIVDRGLAGPGFGSIVTAVAGLTLVLRIIDQGLRITSRADDAKP